MCCHRVKELFVVYVGFEAGIPRNSQSGNSGNEPFVDTGIPDSRIGIPGMSVLARTWTDQTSFMQNEKKNHVLSIRPT